MRLLIFLVVFCSVCTAQEAGETDSESVNTQEGSLNTNTVGSTVSSGNYHADDSVSKTYNGVGSSSSMPVGSAIAPSMLSQGPQTCLQGRGRGIQTALVGYTGGSYRADLNCVRWADSQALQSLGMKVAAISRLCQGSVETFRAMLLSATPCPLISGGKLIVGKRAFLLMKTQPDLYIPDYGKVREPSKHFFFTKRPAVVRFTESQQWYNSILGIGAVDENNESQESGSSGESVSDMFRRSLK